MPDILPHTRKLKLEDYEKEDNLGSLTRHYFQKTLLIFVLAGIFSCRGH